MRKFLIFIPIFFLGCATYQDKFGSKQNAYAGLEESKSLKLGKNAMPKNNLYDLPKLGSKAKKNQVTDVPPTL